ncbi:MAG: hypothetical protein V3V62_02085 [bacterium]
MHPSLEAGLAAIREDRGQGAAQLARRGVGLLAEACALAEESALAEGAALAEEAAGAALLAEAAALVRELRAVRPSMAAVGNWALAFYLDLRERLGRPGGAAPAAAGAEIAAALLRRGEEMRAGLIEAARPLLADADSLLTLSRSSTVEEILLRAAPPSLRVVVAESRPLLEGRKLAESLIRAGREVRCITDAQVGLFMRECSLLLLGADTICSDLAVVNKTGSLPAALAAREAGAPCFVAADTFKVSGSAAEADVVLEEGPGAEVWEEEAGRCANVYFETVPARLISCFITEKGALSHARLREEAALWRRLEEAFAESLEEG